MMQAAQFRYVLYWSKQKLPHQKLKTQSKLLNEMFSGVRLRCCQANHSRAAIIEIFASFLSPGDIIFVIWRLYKICAHIFHIFFFAIKRIRRAFSKFNKKKRDHHHLLFRIGRKWGEKKVKVKMNARFFIAIPNKQISPTRLTHFKSHRHQI